MKKTLAMLAVSMAAITLSLVGCSPSGAASASSAGQSSPPTQSGGASGQGGPNGSAPQNRGNGQGRGPVIFGPVASVEGGILTVTTQQGATKVNIAGAKIQKIAEGTANDLQAGTAVVVTGQQNADGSLAASNIQIRPATTGQSGFQGQGPRQTQGQSQSQSQGRGIRGLFGSVVSLNGSTLAVKDQQGNTTQVDIAGARIEKTVDGTTDDLKVGVTVSVLGQQGSDGTISATSIQIRPARTAGNRPTRGASQTNPNATPSAD